MGILIATQGHGDICAQASAVVPVWVQALKHPQSMLIPEAPGATKGREDVLVQTLSVTLGTPGSALHS